ncbi:MAG: GreA/GreB family elongation factor [Opitutus sp.]
MSKAFLRETDFDDLPPLRPTTLCLPPGVKNYITSEGADRLRSELDTLSMETRPPIAAKALNDAELRRELQAIDQRIRHLQESLRSAEIVTPIPSSDVVRFGSTVKVRDRTGEVSRYRFVGVDETDLERGCVSWRSPLARALLNARAGDTVEVTTPAGTKHLTLISIE